MLKPVNTEPRGSIGERRGIGLWRMARAPKTRLDELLVARELCETPALARALIVAGKVVVGDHTETKPGTGVAADASVRVRGQELPFVSRGGLKLRGALDRFTGIEPQGRVAMDIGASTGGFTDCLLQAGAQRVYAVDVGYGQLAWKLVQDPRVVVLDRTNIRTLKPAQIGEPVSLVVADCSFISLTRVLPCVPPFLTPQADVVLLVKPQFELARAAVGEGGVVREEGARATALATVLAAAKELGFAVVDHCDASLAGQDGNLELLAWLRWGSG
jgi:23S rRNA (cytidine1920-2'-O)/16S rRNA (cytidine1409-2'-O)-methyltransferase